MIGFDYKVPDTVDEAVDLLAEYGSEAKLLAGGQSLLVLMRQRLVAPAVVIGLSRVTGLSEIRVDGSFTVGSMTRYRSLTTGEIGSGLPLLARAGRSVGSVHIRNLGTVGGALAHCDPAGDVPTVLMALGASYKGLSLRGSTTYDSSDFGVGLFETRLADDELLTSIRVPVQPDSATFGYQRFSFREGEYPMVVAACRLEWDSSGYCLAANFAVGGADAFPKRLSAVEAALVGTRFDDGDLDGLLEETVWPELHVAADVRGGVSWKKTVVLATLRRALAEACEGQGRQIDV